MDKPKKTNLYCVEDFVRDKHTKDLKRKWKKHLKRQEQKNAKP